MVAENAVRASNLFWKGEGNCRQSEAGGLLPPLPEAYTKDLKIATRSSHNMNTTCWLPMTCHQIASSECQQQEEKTHDRRRASPHAA